MSESPKTTRLTLTQLEDRAVPAGLTNLSHSQPIIAVCTMAPPTPGTDSTAPQGTPTGKADGAASRSTIMVWPPIKIGAPTRDVTPGGVKNPGQTGRAPWWTTDKTAGFNRIEGMRTQWCWLPPKTWEKGDTGATTKIPLSRYTGENLSRLIESAGNWVCILPPAPTSTPTA